MIIVLSALIDIKAAELLPWERAKRDHPDKEGRKRIHRLTLSLHVAGKFLEDVPQFSLAIVFLVNSDAVSGMAIVQAVVSGTSAFLTILFRCFQVVGAEKGRRRQFSKPGVDDVSVSFEMQQRIQAPRDTPAPPRASVTDERAQLLPPLSPDPLPPPPHRGNSTPALRNRASSEEMTTPSPSPTRPILPRRASSDQGTALRV